MVRGLVRILASDHEDGISLHNGKTLVEPHFNTVIPHRWTVVCVSVFLSTIYEFIVTTRGYMHRALESMVAAAEIICIKILQGFTKILAVL